MAKLSKHKRQMAERIIDESAYELFRRSLVRDDFLGAYGVLKRRPQLVEHMSMLDIPEYYVKMMSIGEREGAKFRSALKDALSNMSEEVRKYDLIFTALQYAKMGADGKITIELAKPSSESDKKLQQIVLREFRKHQRKAFVMVDADNFWITPTKLQHDEEVIEHNKKLLERISQALDVAVRKRYVPVLLGQEAKTLDDPLIYDGFKKHLSSLTFFPPQGDTLSQYLELKQYLVNLRTSGVEVCGFVNGGSVQEVSFLLNGGREYRFGDPRESYLDSARRMGWPDEKFNQIFKANLHSRIRRDLV
jgi:hypothetical protein